MSGAKKGRRAATATEIRGDGRRGWLTPAELVCRRIMRHHWIYNLLKLQATTTAPAAEAATGGIRVRLRK